MHNKGTELYDITPMTMLDYPGKLACIAWFTGCSMRCPYCYNPQVVLGTGTVGLDELYVFLRKRIGLLDGVVLSGGECTAFPKIVAVCRYIKSMGFLVKIDTNGSRPEVINQLLNESLVDYLALDYKAPVGKFYKVTGTECFSTFEQSLNMLLSQTEVEYEVRTTVHCALLDESDINTIIDHLVMLGYNKKYYLQKALENVEMIGELPSTNSWLDLSKLHSKLEIEVRSQ